MRGEAGIDGTKVDKKYHFRYILLTIFNRFYLQRIDV